jgi:hypothetical protein
MARRIMARSVKRMTLAELRHELEVLSVWIRDVTSPKQERKREISKEIERRCGGTGTEGTRRKCLPGQ